MKRRRTIAGLLLAGSVPLCMMLGDPLEAQERCPSGVVTEVRVTNHSIFEEGDIGTGRLSRLRGVANGLHFRTRESLIRSEMTLREGECLDPQSVSDSERILRELPFIARATIETERLGDDVVVSVETWDEWTTSAGIAFSFEDRLLWEGGFLRESNFLGTGIKLVLDHDRSRGRRDYTARLTTTRLAGKRVEGRLEAGRTRDGWIVKPRLTRPYAGEQGRWTADARGLFEDLDHTWATGSRDDFAFAILPLTTREFYLSGERRFGAPGSILSIGAEIDIDRIRVRGAPLVSMDEEFDERLPAPDSLLPYLGAQASPPSAARIGVKVGSRRLRFEEWTGVDLIAGTQDVALGTEVEVVVGRTLGSWGTASLDSYGVVGAFASAGGSRALGQVTVRGEGRLLDDPAGGPRWRDVLWTGRARVFARPSPDSPFNFSATVDAAGGWNTERLYRLTLGGPEGVRSLVRKSFPASKTLVARLEQRWNPVLFAPTVGVGFTTFADLGRGWDGTVPFSRDSGWQHGVGLGLRLGFPARTGSVVHIEAAFPTSDGGRGTVLRLYWSRGTTSR